MFYRLRHHLDTYILPKYWREAYHYLVTFNRWWSQRKHYYCPVLLFQSLAYNCVLFCFQFHLSMCWCKWYLLCHNVSLSILTLKIHMRVFLLFGGDFWSCLPWDQRNLVVQVQCIRQFVDHFLDWGFPICPLFLLVDLQVKVPLLPFYTQQLNLLHPYDHLWTHQNIFVSNRSHFSR